VKDLRSLRKWIDNISWPKERIPQSENLLSLMWGEIRSAHDDLTDKEAALIMERVFAALAEADVRGLITTGNEHEWATLSVQARERSKD
jgi:hypothetical protein